MVRVLAKDKHPQIGIKLAQSRDNDGTKLPLKHYLLRCCSLGELGKTKFTTTWPILSSRWGDEHVFNMNNGITRLSWKKLLCDFLFSFSQKLMKSVALSFGWGISIIFSHSEWGFMSWPKTWPYKKVSNTLRTSSGVSDRKSVGSSPSLGVCTLE